jgi:hypothetical protein
MTSLMKLCYHKRLLLHLALFFALPVLAGCAGFQIFEDLGAAKGYVNDAVPAIVRSWEAKELTSRASPDLVQGTPGQRLDALFDTAAQHLGALKEYRGALCDVTSTTNAGQPPETTAECEAEAEFEKGAARIEIHTRRVAGHPWQITAFRISHEVLSFGEALS